MFQILASLRPTLDQPVFPGKVLVWLLFMLSIIGWVMILSKAIQLFRAKRADRDFTERLSESSYALALYEEDRDLDASPKGCVYRAGAREAAYQLLGSRDPSDAEESRVQRAGSLQGWQLELVHFAFQKGCRVASSKLGANIESLRLIVIASAFIGAIGFVWTLMEAFGKGFEFAEFAPQVGAALGYLVISLGVAGPVAVARMALRLRASRQVAQVEHFRDEVVHHFDRSFSERDVQHVTEPERTKRVEYDYHASAETQLEEENPDSNRQFHSIRRRLRADSQLSDPDLDQMNPIARQAAVGGILHGH